MKNKATIIAIVISCILSVSFNGCNKDSNLLNANITSKSLPSSSGSFSFIIESDTKWNISSDAGWCTITPNSGKGNSEITVDFQSNVGGMVRNAVISIEGRNSNPIEILISQKAKADNPNFTTSVSDPFGISGESMDINFVDIDNDGDMDAFIARGSYGVRYMKNTGSASSPVFTQSSAFGISEDAMGINFVDIDNDGDMDAFIAGGSSGISYWENTGSANYPSFTQSSDLGISEDAISIDFVDIDNDGDMDAFLPYGGYGVSYWENTGSANSPSFTKSSAFELSGGATDIDFVDIDDDGDMDAFLPYGSYGISYWKNTGSANSPSFTKSSSVSFSEDTWGLDFVDIDNDGDQDAFFAYGSYGVFFYENHNL